MKVKSNMVLLTIILAGCGRNDVTPTTLKEAFGDGQGLEVITQEIAEARCVTDEREYSAGVIMTTEPGSHGLAIKATSSSYYAGIESYELILSTREIHHKAHGPGHNVHEVVSCRHATEGCEMYERALTRMLQIVTTVTDGIPNICAPQSQLQTVKASLSAVAGS
jgi:hypothetical protein